MVAMVAIDDRTRIASSRRPTPPPSCEMFFLRVLTEGWPWWPWWPSMVGHESRRPTAQAEAHEWMSAWLRVRGPVESACAWLATTCAQAEPDR